MGPMSVAVPNPESIIRAAGRTCGTTRARTRKPDGSLAWIISLTGPRTTKESACCAAASVVTSELTSSTRGNGQRQRRCAHRRPDPAGGVHRQPHERVQRRVGGEDRGRIGEDVVQPGQRGQRGTLGGDVPDDSWKTKRRPPSRSARGVTDAPERRLPLGGGQSPPFAVAPARSGLDPVTTAFDALGRDVARDPRRIRRAKTARSRCPSAGSGHSDPVPPG